MEETEAEVEAEEKEESEVMVEVKHSYHQRKEPSLLCRRVSLCQWKRELSCQSLLTSTPKVGSRLVSARLSSPARARCGEQAKRV